MRKANVWITGHLAGTLSETDNGYQFQYNPAYLQLPGVEPVSLTLPITEKPYNSQVMFPFFDGLVPEGWLLEVAERNWKLNPRDRMGLLLACCRDCIGAVSITNAENPDQ